MVMHSGATFLIRDAAVGDMATVAALFREYAQGIGVDLAYQGFENELAALPGVYAPPRGVLLLATSHEGRPIGCVAVRPMAESDCCEMKRLHIRREARGSGLGRALAESAIDAARKIGYARMRLDTLPTMIAAQALYAKLGFSIIDAY